MSNRTGQDRIHRVAASLTAASFLMITVVQASAQTLPGAFDEFNPWWIDPVLGTSGVNPGAQICIDLDGNGSTESCYNQPGVPAGTLTNLQLSPTRRVLMAYGNTTACGPSTQPDTVYFFEVPDPPGQLLPLDNACIPNGINAGHVGFYDTGLCCNGLTDLSCPSSGLDCSDGMGGSLLGVSPQRIAYVADQGDANQRIQITWFDLNAGTHAQTFPGFNSSLQLTKVQVSPYGDAAFVQHDVGGSPDSDYTVVDLCAVPRLGDPLSSVVGGALFDLDLPIATATMVDNGGSYTIVVDHPDLTGGQAGIPFTPCEDDPPPVTGACCRSEGCTTETSDDCDGLGGQWLGPDTVCGDCPMGTLTVNIEGPGSVSSSPSGISCPSDCDETYTLGQSVMLTASPSAEAQFSGWGGDCSGLAESTNVTVDGARKCTATFNPVADLVIDMADSPDPVVAGTSVTYLITVNNQGPADATGVQVTHFLPGSVTFESRGTDPACEYTGFQVVCDFGDIASGGTVQVSVSGIVAPEQRGSISSSASVSAGVLDPMQGNNNVSAFTAVIAEADLLVVKTATPDPVEAGGKIFYEIEVTNAGPSSATLIDIQDTLPSGVTPSSGEGDPTQLGCGGSSPLPVGGSQVVGFTVDVDPNLPPGTILTNTVTVSSAETDPDPSNNTAEVDSQVTGMITAPAATGLQRLVDTDTPIPGGTGTFANFGVFQYAALSEGYVSFRGRGTGQDGIYRWYEGVLSVIADINTPIPGGTGTFGAPATGGFGPPSADGADVAFNGDNFNITQRGIYALIDGVLRVIADRNTAPPGSFTPFSTMALGGLDDGRAGFWAFVPAAPILGGIYYAGPGEVTKVADQTTFIPGGGGQFNSFSSRSEQKRGTVIFYGYDSLFNAGLYRWTGGVLSVVADRFTPIPGGGGNFSLFYQRTAFDGVNLAFYGENATGTLRGIYLTDCGGMRVVADTNTPVPCGTGTFESFGDMATDEGNVAFVALGSGTSGVYAEYHGKLIRVLEALDRIDGRKAFRFRFGPESFKGDQLAISVTFTDGVQAIYLATLTDSGVCAPFEVDDDDDHDLADAAGFANCRSGDGEPYPDGCAAFDGDGDGDVDLDDHLTFHSMFDGPRLPTPPAACCLPSQQGCAMHDPEVCEFLLNGEVFPGETCADDPCALEVGACCTFKGCIETDEMSCLILEGQFFPGQGCKSAPCTP